MNQADRTIAVATGSRAEFGLLQPVMRAIADRPGLTLRTLAAGAHLLADTVDDIAAAGFTIDARVPMQQPGTTGRAADADALGRGVRGFAEAFARLDPTFVVVLGDRIEAFAAAAAASIGGIRVAHIHGGDRAEGVADEAMRHAITKLAHLHLPATAESRRRIVRMGEPPASVHRVGSPAIDGLREVSPADDAPRAIVMQHPIGEADEDESRWMRATLEATASLTPRVVMAPNADPGAGAIRRAMAEVGIEPVEHVNRGRFLALLKAAAVLVGNSSAGLIEAAALRTPVVNIGPRQAGRQRPGNVVDCDYGRANVEAAIARARALDLAGMRHPYGKGKTGPTIARLLAEIDLETIPLRKRNRY